MNARRHSKMWLQRLEDLTQRCKDWYKSIRTSTITWCRFQSLIYKRGFLCISAYATMAELADARDLKSLDSNIIRVQVSLVVLTKRKDAWHIGQTIIYTDNLIRRAMHIRMLGCASHLVGKEMDRLFFTLLQDAVV